MRELALAAALLWAAGSSATAQDFNPGTVIGNVYQNPASGCGYGYGFPCNGYGRYGAVPAQRAVRSHRHHRRDEESRR